MKISLMYYDTAGQKISTTSPGLHTSSTTSVNLEGSRIILRFRVFTKDTANLQRSFVVAEDEGLRNM